eukprot:scaffold1375_cov137-Cylindrotheca_fusiformis.AAC.4
MDVTAAFKKKKNEPLGLGIMKIAGKDGLFISKIQPGGKIATNAKQLKAGMKLISLNGKPCPGEVDEALAILKDAKGKLKIVAQVPVAEKRDDRSHSGSRSYDSRSHSDSRSYDSRGSRSYSDSRSYDSRDSRSYRTGDSRSYRTGDSRSYRSGDSRSSRTGDSQSYRTGDSRSYRTGDSQSYRTGDSRSYRTGDSRSYRTGDSRSYRTGDSRSYRTGDSKSYRTGDSKSRRTGDSRSRRTGDSRSVYSDEMSRHSGDSRSFFSDKGAGEKYRHVGLGDKQEEEKFEMDEVDPGEDRARSMIVEIWVLAAKEETANASKAAAALPKSTPAAKPPTATKQSPVEVKSSPPRKVDTPPEPMIGGRPKEEGLADASVSDDEASRRESPLPMKNEMSRNDRRLAIANILKDDSLSGPEKQERIKALRPPPLERRTVPPQKSGGDVESEAAIRRKAIQAVHADKTLSPKQKHTKIQELIKTK